MPDYVIAIGANAICNITGAHQCARLTIDHRDSFERTIMPSCRQRYVHEAPFLILGAIVLVIFLFRAHLRVLDDAYITYRFAQHLNEGRGLIWNVGGARTEGFTSLLHVLLCAVALRLGIDPVVFTRILSVSALFGTALICRCWVRAAAVHCGWLAASTWVLVLGNGCLVYASLFGMETVLFTFLLTAAAFGWWLSCEFGTPRAMIASSSIFALAIMCRPDACAWVISALAVGALFGRRMFSQGENGTKCFRVFAGSSFVLALAATMFFAGKYAYFGKSLPNPFHIKAAVAPHELPGMTYVLQFIVWGAPLFAACIYGLFMKRSPSYYAMVVPALIFVAAFLKIRPLMGTAFRFLVPAWPVLTVGAIIGISHYLRRREESRGTTSKHPAVSILLGAWLAVWTVTAYLHVERTLENRNAFHYGMIGRKLRAADIVPIPTVAAHDQGALPYFSGWRSLDFVGLTTNEVARMRHGAEVASFILGKQPEVIVLRRRRDAGLDIPIFIPHARDPEVAASIWSDTEFQEHYRLVGSFPDEEGRGILFYVDDRASTAAGIRAALCGALVEIVGHTEACR